MSSLLEGVKKLVTRGGGDIGPRIEALQAAADASRGRLDDDLVDRAEQVADRAATRLRLSSEHTVVAIAGATGSGKSSTFNALTGLELSSVGVRRPTTSWATACVWGTKGAEDLLDWLGIAPRHRTMRDSALDIRADGEMDGVVLLDLPDHDSTEVAHHLEVDRLVELADLLVWVLDPQKYADAAIHDRYLAPLAGHAGVMLVVLNHIDRVPEDRRPSMLADVRRLLDADGLAGVPLIAISAREDIGVAELRGAVVDRVRSKQATRGRLEADIAAIAQELRAESGAGEAREVTSTQSRALLDALADSAGVPIVVDAVERSTRLRAERATGWPVVAWLGRLRPDPLKRLHLDLGDSAKALSGTARTSLPQTTPVQRARVDSEIRDLADTASSGLGRPWADAVRGASTARLDEVSDRLDVAMAQTDLDVAKLPAWAGLVRCLQWVLILAALTGLVWLGVDVAMTAMELDPPAPPEVLGLILPTLLLLGGLVLGILLALVCRALVATTARRKAAVADRRLRGAVQAVAQELVLDPMAVELSAHSAFRSALSRAG